MIDKKRVSVLDPPRINPIELAGLSGGGLLSNIVGHTTSACCRDAIKADQH